jgi:uncharacterized repeat protein (TIGR03803 family)
MKFFQTVALMLLLTGSIQAQNFSVLFDFNDSGSGGGPVAPLIQGPDGRLYGTAPGGGSLGGGVVFAINTDGTGYTNFYAFSGDVGSGSQPNGGLLLSGNTFFGTTAQGAGTGTIFALAADGSSYTTLHSFSTRYGYHPLATLIMSGSTLYGTTEYGGPNNFGTLFSFNTTNNYFTNFYNFTNSAIGEYPYAGLVVSGNRLYGTTYQGGSNNWGTVFAVDTDGGNFTNLYNFAYSDGANPYGGLLLVGNRLYGTTYQGGPGAGNIFAINTDGSGFTNIYNFQDAEDGAYPRAALILNGDTLYGVASGGGSNSIGSGTIFSVETNGLNFTNYYTFSSDGTGLNNDGAFPVAPLLLLSNTLYGVTSQGGTNGQGTIFSLTLPQPPQPPSLSVQISGSELILTWPSNATGYSLLSATNLSFSGWSAVTNTPVIIDSFYTVTNATSSGQMFYYLSQ